MTFVDFRKYFDCVGNSHIFQALQNQEIQINTSEHLSAGYAEIKAGKKYPVIYSTWPHYYNHLQFSQYLDITFIILLKTD